MIQRVIGKIFICFLIAMILLLVFFVYSIRLYSKPSMKDMSPPEIFNVLYDFYKTIPIISSLQSFMQSAYYFLSANKVKSRLLATCYVSMLPGIYLLTFTIFNIFADAWYLKLFGAVFSLLLPIYFVRNLVVRKVLNARLMLMKTFNSLSSLLSSNTVDGAMRVLLTNSTGVPRNIINEFLNKYSIDREDAYYFLQTVSSDNSIEALARYLKELDINGKEDYDVLKMNLTIGNRLNTLVYRDSLAFKNAHAISLIILVGSVFFKKLGASLVAGSPHTGVVNLGIYIAVAMCIISYTLASVYSSNSI